MIPIKKIGAQVVERRNDEEILFAYSFRGTMAVVFWATRFSSSSFSSFLFSSVVSKSEFKLPSDGRRIRSCKQRC